MDPFDHPQQKTSTVPAGVSRTGDPAPRSEALPDAAELARLTHMAQAGLLAAGLIHDLRNTLTAIRWRCERAGERLSGADRVEVDRVLSIAKGADEGLGAYLAYVRGAQSTAVSPLEAVINSVRTLANKGGRGAHIPLNVHVAEGLAVKCPGPLLQQVLTNLVINARQAIGGRQGEVRIEARSQGGMISIQVIDDGPGIPAAVMERLFEPFASHGKAEGTGLGLFGARHIVEKHGGRLELRWSDGRGTCFEALLPAAF